MGNPNRQSLVAGPAVARTMLTLAVALLLNLGFAGQIHAQTYSVIHNFVGSFDGSEPASGVTVDAAGNLYGSTFFGDQATGTVYKLARRSGGWVLFPLMYFTNMATGVIPYDQPVFGPDGAIYLTTGFGGVGPCFTYNNTTGCGVMMTLKPLPTPPPTPLTPWNETLLYKFTGGADGGNPYSATILFDGPTNIYSTTFMGGSSLCSGGCGVVYKMTKTNGTWSENVLYTFTNGSDGAHPWSGLTADHSGNFYGTTSAGGTGGFGTVFELSPNGSGGWNLRTLYSFTGQDDGGTPFSGLEAAKARADVFTSTLTQRALWRFMDGPAYARHLRSARALYRERRDAFLDALARDVPWAPVLPPAAGVNVWLPLPARLTTHAAFDACAREGVLVMPAEPFYPTRNGPPALRLSFGHLPVEEAREGVARLGRALTKLLAPPPARARSSTRNSPREQRGVENRERDRDLDGAERQR